MNGASEYLWKKEITETKMMIGKVPLGRNLSRLSKS